jgi:hypothetical protein
MQIQILWAKYTATPKFMSLVDPSTVELTVMCAKQIAAGNCEPKKQADIIIKKEQATRFQNCNEVYDIEDTHKYLSSEKNNACPYFWLKEKTC